jgi:hypothetical protein
VSPLRPNRAGQFLALGSPVGGYFKKIGRRIHCSFRHYQWLTLVSKAANRLRSKVEGLRTWVALHLLSPEDICGAVSFILSFVVSTFLPPFAPRALPRFFALTKVLSPFGARFFGSFVGHERRSFPQIVIPDSCRSNFLPFYSPPTPCTPSPTLTVSPPERSPKLPCPSRVGVRFWASLTVRKLANASGRMVFNIVLFMDWQFVSGCFPPRLSTTRIFGAVRVRVRPGNIEFEDD